MAWQIALCDDEASVRDRLQEYLTRFALESGEAFCVHVFESAEALLASPVEHHILLLDIQMGGQSGMAAARELRRRGSQVLILFITALSGYAIEGYEVHAFSFLEKPLLYERFALRLGDALRALKRSESVPLQFHTSVGLIQVSSREVCYIESFRHEIRFVCLDLTFTESEVSLSRLEAQLSGYGFFRVHKSYLVNMRNIRLIGECTVTMLNECTAPISKYRRREFLSAYAGYRKELL